MKFQYKRWYKSFITQSNDPFALSPYIAFYHNENEVNYRQYGIHTFFPQFCTNEEFEKKIDVNRPLTEEQAKYMYDFVNEQVKKSREKE